MSLQCAANEIVDLLREAAINPVCSRYSPSCMDFFDLTELARQRMDWGKAIQLCEKAAQPCAISDTAYYCQSIAEMLLAVIYQSMGDLEAAEQRYRLTAASLNDSKHKDVGQIEAIAHYALGLVWRGKGDLDEAQRAFKQCLSADSGSARLKDRAEARIEHARILRFQKEQAHAQKNSVPVIGTTAGGEPIHAIEILQGAFLDRLILNGRNCRIKCLIGAGRGAPAAFRASDSDFALVVEGNSMMDVGIGDGDYVIFRRQEKADDGDIVVVRIDDPEGSKSTVKQLNHQGKTVILKAKNPDFTPQVMIFAEADPTIEILGRAVAVAAKV